MCGITGIVNLSGEPVSPVLLKHMTDAIAHRGPDGEGFFYDKNVGMGHRRLSILDLSPAGQQPMSMPNGDYVLTYNGEIYNFQTLKLELQAKGHFFHSRTDSEVLLHALAEWGIDAMKRLNGMFAFALLDRQNNCLWLARDRYGIKPLYYTVQNGKLLWASEIKALLTHPDCAAQVDKEALLEYFTFQNFFTNRTLFAQIETLPAGHFMKVNLTDSNVSQPICYWDFHFAEPEHPATDAEYAEELDRLFQQAVNRQLVSDVDVGAYLSGGMDSGSITALASLQNPYMKSFTVGFDLHSISGLEIGYDERSKAEHMSYLFKTEHYEMVLKAGDMERAMPHLAWHLEEPRVGQSYPNYYAAKLAGKFVKVCLSGAGGDELFGGYPWRYYRAVMNDDFENYIDKYYLFWQRLIPNKTLQQIFKPIWPEVSHVWTRDIFSNVFSQHASSLTRPEDYVNHSLYFEAKTFLHGLLVVEDKLSMAHGLEVRVPFLDNDLVDFAMRVPCHLKLGNLADVIRLNENEPGMKNEKYFQKTRDGKLLLRQVMQKHIPTEVTQREKQGFSAPDASWFKGESMEFVRRTLFNPNARIYDYFDPKAVQAVVTAHLEGRENRRLFIWSLLNFESWCENFLSLRASTQHESARIYQTA